LIEDCKFSKHQRRLNQGEGDKGTMKVADFAKLILDEVDALVSQYDK